MRYALTHATVLDGTKDMEPKENVTVLVDGEKIVDVTAGPAPSGFEEVDLGGRFLMPGLINMHVHLAGNGKPQKKQRDNTKLVKTIFGNPIGPKVAHALVAEYARIELMSGVTTVRTVGGLRDLDTRVRDEIASGKRLGARILASNEGISVPGGHMAGSVAVPAESIPQAVSLVRKVNAQHVDLVKLMITGGVMDAKAKGVPGELKMDPTMVRACCDEAHKLGYLVAAHVESPQGVRVALENGVDSIEHGAKPDADTMDLFLSRGAFLTTTISPALPYALFDQSVSNASDVERFNGNVVFEGIIDCARAALASGVPVALGNDVGCPWITQYDFWRELVYFRHYVGASRALALHTATLGNATLAGIGGETGSVEAGKCADLVVCAENPLEDLRALRHVDMIMARGNLVRNPKVSRNAKVDAELNKYLPEG